jgi:tocopherol O-methyltransferase
MSALAADALRREVAAHYDDLDRFYREIWGEHVHHGLWSGGREDASAATRRLIDVVAGAAEVGAGDRVCDVGCGYGGTSRVLVHDYAARVTALTISQAQFAFAQAVQPGADNPVYLLRDWLSSGLDPATFDAVIAIESSEHMPDLPAFFQEAARVLRPGGRLVVCAWLTRELPRRWERRWLLDPICREGRLRGMESMSEYERLARQSGLVPTRSQDVSRQVKRTWTICARRVVLGLVSKPAYRRFLLHAKTRNRIFALTVARIWLAYALGTMRYGILTAVKPACSEPVNAPKLHEV